MWIWGDMHVHSYWSDGLDSIAQIVKCLRKCEEDFHFQTDHCGIKMPEGTYLRKTDVAEKSHLLVPESFSKYIGECNTASEDNYIVIPGIELDLDYGSYELNARNYYTHIKVYGFSASEQLPPEGWYRNKSLFTVLSGLKKRGLTVFLAHTNGDFLPWQKLDNAELFDGFEVFYSIRHTIDPMERGVFKCGYWDKWLTAGRRIPISTGSDCHQADCAVGSSMRNVVWVDKFSPNSILKSVKEGKSYLSGTWHPNIYLEYGLTPNDARWFCLVEGNNRRLAKPIIEKFRLQNFKGDYLRVKKKNFPTMKFKIEEHNIGDIVSITRCQAIEIKIEINMHVPIQWIDIIESGVPIKRFTPDNTTFFSENFSYKTGKFNSYIRIQSMGKDKADHTEWLISNPIYLMKSRIC